MSEREIFLEALDRSDPAQRAAYLDLACGADAARRTRIEALIVAHEAAGGFLRTADREADTAALESASSPPANSPGSTDAPPTAAHAGDLLSDTQTFQSSSAATGLLIAGRYTLEQKLGEGGMGEVWVAKQSEPVKRRVALKLIKQGMDSRAVLQRFEQERQALALMDHPSIARVLDAGLTPTGQPFFVMELVNGAPLTRFCDELKLTPKERLELFVPICQAVQHAHQKGIVHRDLKPANILVTMIDGRPVPKIIDFGVAKATAGKLTDESMSTQFGAVLGTLEYMSPEQAGFSSEDIDTRADIYSLGVILYELLTGLRPIDAARLRKAALTEMIRIIREEEPSKPSTRLSTHESLPSLAAVRQIEPRKLTALLRGELDWVVMKCLEKNRDRRYETANGLARDVQRYLDDEPVEARPPSAGYRFQKFVTRHKGQVIAASLVMLALLGGIIGTTYGLLRAHKAAAAERQAKLDAQEKRDEAEKQKTRAESREQQAIDAVKRFRDAVASNPELKNNSELEILRKTLLKEPLAFFKTLREQLQADNDTRPEALQRLAQAAYELGELTNEIGDKQDAIRALKTAREIWERLVRDHPTVTEYASELAATHNSLGVLSRHIGDLAAARCEYEAAQVIQEGLSCDHPTVPDYAKELAATHGNLGVLHQTTSDPAGARREYEAAREIQERLVRVHPAVTDYAKDLAATYANLGNLLAATGDPAGARRSYEAAREIDERLARENPNNTAFAQGLAAILTNLGSLHRDTGDPAGARRAHEAAREIEERLTREHPSVVVFAKDLAETDNSLGYLFLITGDPAGARRSFEESRQIQERLARDHPTVTAYAQDLAGTHGQLGVVLGEIGDLAGARRSLEAALVIQERLAGEHPKVAAFAKALATTQGFIGDLQYSTGDPAGARQWYESAREILERLTRENPAVTDYARDLALTYSKLGVVLREANDLVGARGWYEAAREIQERVTREYPDNPDLTNHLGGTFGYLAQLESDAGRFAAARDLLRKAIFCQRKALASNPRNPQYREFLQNHYSRLVTAAQGLDDPALAAEAQRELVELAENDPRFEALDARMKAVMKGETVNDNGERLAIAQRAYDTKRFRLAAKLFDEALAADPKLAADRQQQVRYNAACCAALAAASPLFSPGEGRGAGPGDSAEPTLDNAAKATLRNQARAWLAAELATWTKLLESAKPEQRVVIAHTLEHWKADTDLAGIRDEAQLGELPDDERTQWQKLWGDVNALLLKTTAE